MLKVGVILKVYVYGLTRQAHLAGFTQSLPSVAAMAVLLHQITALLARQGAQQQPQSLSEERLQLRLQWYRCVS